MTQSQVPKTSVSVSHKFLCETGRETYVGGTNGEGQRRLQGGTSYMMVRQPHPESAFLWPQFVTIKQQDGSVVPQVHTQSSTLHTVSDCRRLFLPPFGCSMAGHVSKKGDLHSDYEMIREEEWKRGKSRDHFHKVPCVRPPDQAKRNITSIALIKAQPRWWKNNDVRATALLRTDRKKSFHPVSCPMALSCLHFSPSIDGLHKILWKIKKHTLPVRISFQSNCTERPKAHLFSQSIKKMWFEMTETSLPF